MIIIHLGKLYVLLHDKHELIRTLNRYLHSVSNFGEIDPDDNHITFEIIQVTKIKYRTGGSISCDPNLLSDDLMWLKHVVGKVGCIPKYWEGLIIRSNNQTFSNMMKGVDICNSTRQFTNLSSYFPLDHCGALGKAKSILEEFKRSCHQMRIMTTTKLAKWEESNILKLQFR